MTKPSTVKLSEAEKLWDWLFTYLVDECDLVSSCVSAVDRSNLINGIANTLADQSDPSPKTFAEQVIDASGAPGTDPTEFPPRQDFEAAYQEAAALRALSQTDTRSQHDMSGEGR